MSLGLIGKKIGMSRVFLENGASVAVTVVEVTPNRVTQLKTKATDGYEAIQITAGLKKKSRVNKPMAGHFAKAKVEPGVGLWEFTLGANDKKDWQAGESIEVDMLQAGQKIDVTSHSKGKGYAGCVKRHNFRTQDATHGNSVSHRAPGSIGQNQTPGRVFKGKKMSGHLGDVQVSVQNLEVIRVDKDKQLLLIKGAVPGAPGGYVMIKPAVKKQQTAVTA